MNGRSADSKSAKHGAISWWRRSSFHSQVMGSTACLLVCAAIAFVYCDGARFHLETSSGVSPEETIEVLRNANQWQKLHQECQQANSQLEARIASLAEWVPKSINPGDINAKLETLSKANGVQLVSLDYQRSNVGSRVGVAIFTCHLRGHFSSISRTLDGLSKLDHPIACDRINISHSADADSTALACDAVVSLRCPYAADGTLASRLLEDTNNHGS